METAVNLLLDGAPLLGEKVMIFGLGVVGLLTAGILQQFPLAQLIGIDLHEKRRHFCTELGVNAVFDANHEKLVANLNEYLMQHTQQKNVDLIYELTGNPQVLNWAIDMIGYEGRIVLGSWYGKKQEIINLGGKFHRNRIQLIASQVSTIASTLQGRWNKARRFELALELIKKIKPAKFITHKFHITQADQVYRLLENIPQGSVQIIFTYEGT